MRKLLMMLAMLTVVVLSAGREAQWVFASQTCTTPCSSGPTLSCTASTTCSASSGTLVCCGVTHTCAAINSWESCENNCTTAFNRCVGTCKVFNPCVANCTTAERTCKATCGSEPPTGFSC